MLISRGSKCGGKPGGSQCRHTAPPAQAPTPPSRPASRTSATHIHPLCGHCQGTVLASPRHPLWTLLKLDSHLRELHLKTSPVNNSPCTSSTTQRPVFLQHREQIRAQWSTFPWKQAAFLCLLTALDSFLSKMLGHRTGVSKPGSNQAAQS